MSITEKEQQVILANSKIPEMNIEQYYENQKLDYSKFKAEVDRIHPRITVLDPKTKQPIHDSVTNKNAVRDYTCVDVCCGDTDVGSNCLWCSSNKSTMN